MTPDIPASAPDQLPPVASNGWNWKPKLRWFAAEILVIVTGVLIALALNAWWVAHSDRAQEAHLLNGIQADLELDLNDLNSALNGARTRAIAADDLLGWIDDSDAGIMAFDDRYQESLDEARALTPERASPSQTLARLADQFRFDVTDATFREAIASGQWKVVRDLDSRRAITLYYTVAASFGRTPDDRVEGQALQFRKTLADAGLAPSGTYPDDTILAALRTDRSLVAELKNLREHALRQIIYHTFIYEKAELLISILAE